MRAPLTHRVLAFPLVVAVGVALGSCSDSTGTGGGFSQEEKTAVATAIINTGALAGSPVAPFVGFVLFTVDQLGSMGVAQQAVLAEGMQAGLVASASGALGTSYEQAFGVAVSFDVTSQGQTTTGYITGVVGWNGLNVQARTVSEMVTAALIGVGATAPSSGSETIESGNSYASYWDGSQAYVATSGAVDVSASFSGSSRDCSQSGQGVTVTCSYSAGTMEGGFSFAAAGLQGGTYVQSPVPFSLPAVRVNISVVTN